jgi:hypothetical protein
MKMKQAILLVLLVLAGCTTSTIPGPKGGDGSLQGTDDISIVMLHYGAFTPMDMVRSELRVTKDDTVFKLFDSEDEVSYEFTKRTDPLLYAKLLSASSGFAQLDTLYGPKEGDPLVTDVGTAEITFTQGTSTKTVKVDPYFDAYMPQKLKDIDAIMRDMQQAAMSLDEPQGKAIAEAWIKSAPTYKFDGSALESVSFARLESYPEQYALDYKFTSSHGGYGDRTGEQTTQAFTQHTINVVISGSKVLSALIDDKWDELAQVDVTVPVEMKFQPMQCQDTPWQRWYKDGGIQFIKAPTEEELATAYFSYLSISATDFRMVDTGMAVCQACDTCPTSHYFTMKVPYAQVQNLIYEGFVRA